VPATPVSMSLRSSRRSGPVSNLSGRVVTVLAWNRKPERMSRRLRLYSSGPVDGTPACRYHRLRRQRGADSSSPLKNRLVQEQSSRAEPAFPKARSR